MTFNSSILRCSFAASLLLVATFFYAESLPVKAQSSNRTAEAAGGLSTKQRLEVFEEVWAAVNEKYYDPKFNGVDWKAARERYRPQAEKAASEAELYNVLSLMVGELHDAHTRVRSPRERRERKNLQATNAGVRLFEIEGAPIVASVAPDSEAARAGVAPGMIVQTVDGRPIAKALAEAESYLNNLLKKSN